MVSFNRTLLVLCFAGSLLQGSHLQAWSFSGFRNWARQNPVTTQLTIGGLAVAALAVLQTKALKHMPMHWHEKMKQYPGRTFLCACACAGLAAWGLIKALNDLCAPNEAVEQQLNLAEEQTVNHAGAYEPQSGNKATAVRATLNLYPGITSQFIYEFVFEGTDFNYKICNRDLNTLINVVNNEWPSLASILQQLSESFNSNYKKRVLNNYDPLELATPILSCAVTDEISIAGIPNRMFTLVSC